LCACIVMGAGIRVVRRTLTNPFATMDVDEQLGYAARAIDAGDCRTARAAIESVKRQAPNAPEVRLIQQNYRHRCGP